MQQRFAAEFAEEGLTISAGLALVKPKFPIQRAAERAEELLAAAKAEGKDRMAAFGQVWEWKHHRVIEAEARKLSEWVFGKQAQRGWFNDILQIAEAARQTGPFRTDGLPLGAGEIYARAKAGLLATARLAYQAGRPRKYKRDFAHWVRTIVADLEEARQPATRFLPAILRCAIALTRQLS